MKLFFFPNLIQNSNQESLPSESLLYSAQLPISRLSLVVVCSCLQIGLNMMVPDKSSESVQGTVLQPLPIDLGNKIQLCTLLTSKFNELNAKGSPDTQTNCPSCKDMISKIITSRGNFQGQNTSVHSHVNTYCYDLGFIGMRSIP